MFEFIELLLQKAFSYNSLVWEFWTFMGIYLEIALFN